MISRTERLPREAFALAWKTAKRKQLPFGQLLFVLAPDFRVSVVVSKKVEKTAVGRNRIKRRLYGLMHRLQVEQNLTGHYIVVVNPNIRNLSSAAIEAALRPLVSPVLKGVQVRQQ